MLEGLQLGELGINFPTSSLLDLLLAAGAAHESECDLESVPAVLE